jgi:hypothetical protein
MLTLARDTSPEAEKVLIELLRAAPACWRVRRMRRLAKDERGAVQIQCSEESMPAQGEAM